MTNKEFWKLKVGDVIIDQLRERTMRVVKRSVEDQICGMIISKKATIDIKNGKKYVQLTLREVNYKTYYFYNSTMRFNMQFLQKVNH